MGKDQNLGKGAGGKEKGFCFPYSPDDSAVRLQKNTLHNQNGRDVAAFRFRRSRTEDVRSVGSLNMFCKHLIMHDRHYVSLSTYF